MFVDTARAQAIFDTLPAEMRWPTLSPGYVAVDALRDTASRPVFLAEVADDGVLMHALLEADVPGGDGCDWQSAYGYGGPIAHGLSGDALACAWSRLDAIASERGIVAEFVRFHPALDNQAAYPGTVRRDRAVVLVDLGVPDLLASYSGRARTAVRKALRNGLRAQWETAAGARAEFPAFYRRSMREIGASDFYLFGDAYFDALLALPDARVLSIVQGDERISMGLFLFGPVQAEYHLSGTSPAGRRAGATSLLLSTAAETARGDGCRWLYLGGGTTNSDDDALLRFKNSFAPAGRHFHIGYRIHDARRYQTLRDADPDRARNGRILFYRN